jgi:excisionase family DNA binding protein
MSANCARLCGLSAFPARRLLPACLPLSPVADKRFAKCGETFWRVVERYQDRVPVSRLERDDAGAALQPGVDTCGCVTGVSAARGREARGERAGVGRLHGDAVQAKHWLHDTRSCVTDRLLTADDVSVLLNVPVSWVRESTRSGAMPVVELGRYRRYREADVLAWLDACSRPGRPIVLRPDIA